MRYNTHMKTYYDYHADDYGLSINNSIQILDCIKAGRLDSISVMPNMDTTEEAIRMLRDAWPDLKHKPLITVHIDLVDGRALSHRSASHDNSNSEAVGNNATAPTDAVDEAAGNNTASHDATVSKVETNTASRISDSKGLITSSWGQLFIHSFLPGRASLRAELVEEIRAQIDKVQSLLPDTELRLDSHMHTHMIPVVRDAIMEVIDTDGLEVAFIRDAAEPLGVFLKQGELLATYSPVNIVKNVILNILSPRLLRECRKRNIASGCLWGLIMSGHMDKERIEKILPSMNSYMDKHHAKNNSTGIATSADANVVADANANTDTAACAPMVMEILAHPGRVLESELSECHNKPDIYSFYISDEREIERIGVMEANRSVTIIEG